ncbi:MAG: hypothetical protein CVU43_24985, partial [Chloroflexi bacterium HGW-Chloroflexi-5]
MAVINRYKIKHKDLKIKLSDKLLANQEGKYSMFFLKMQGIAPFIVADFIARHVYSCFKTIFAVGSFFINTGLVFIKLVVVAISS